MKPITLSVCLSILLFVSCKSKEERATELIKGELFKTLVDFSSYEPVETVIDSAFNSIYRDSTILVYGYMLKQLLNDVNDYLDEIKDAQSTLGIWGDSYSSYGISKYNEAKKEAESNLELARITMTKVNEISDSIRVRAKGFTRSFSGWQVKHKFRCKNKGGNYDLANYIYYTDPKFKKIIYQEDSDDTEIQEIRNLIKEAFEKKDSSE